MATLPKSPEAFESREQYPSLRGKAQKLIESGVVKATVTLFKPSGKYYTEAEWLVPEDAIGPYDMRRSPDCKLAPGWSALVGSIEPWGYPHLIHGESRADV